MTVASHTTTPMTSTTISAVTDTPVHHTHEFDDAGGQDAPAHAAGHARPR